MIVFISEENCIIYRFRKINAFVQIIHVCIKHFFFQQTLKGDLFIMKITNLHIHDMMSEILSMNYETKSKAI